MKLVLLSLLALFVSACDQLQDSSHVNSDATKIVSIISADGKRHDFNIELALTAAQQQQGLMNRTQMDSSAGMMFVFPGEGERSFWMKNTLIPLDMIFIKRDGTIHLVHDSAKPNDLSSVHSQGPVMAVLELNGGVSKKLGIRKGDVAHHPFFGNSFY